MLQVVAGGRRGEKVGGVQAVGLERWRNEVVGG